MLTYQDRESKPSITILSEPPQCTQPAQHHQHPTVEPDRHLEIPFILRNSTAEDRRSHLLSPKTSRRCNSTVSGPAVTNSRATDDHRRRRGVSLPAERASFRGRTREPIGITPNRIRGIRRGPQSGLLVVWPLSSHRISLPHTRWLQPTRTRVKPAPS